MYKYVPYYIIYHISGQWTFEHLSCQLTSFMYRRPILCTLYGAVDFLKVLKIAVVGGEGGGCYSMAGKKHWDVMYTLRPSRRSTET
jgi:hypothetical protein